MTEEKALFAEAARIASLQRRRVPRHCADPQCGLLFMGQRTSRYCSARCKARHYYHLDKGSAR